MAFDLIPSTTPGMVWGLNVMRLSNGRIIASAQEGRHKPADKPGGFEGFNFMMFQDRNVAIPLPVKRLTDKARKEGREAIIAKLVADGMAVAA